MKNSAFELDQSAGEIREGDIRYLMMRPDVLMGTLRYLDDCLRLQVLEAMTKSAYVYGRQSISAYRNRAQLSSDNLLFTVFQMASQLGWGSWRYFASENGKSTVTVINSPFSTGFGSSSVPVCAPISGILGALFAETHGAKVSLFECKCASQGHGVCEFEIAIV